MRKNFGPQNWLYPMPVLIVGSWNSDGSANAMTAAWGGIHDTNKIAVCVDPGHLTADNIVRTGCFTVSIGDAAHVTACDYFGIVSGREDQDKIAKAGVHAIPAEHVNAPLFDEFAMTLECRLISFDNQTGCTVAEIVNISADERILDENGKISAEKLDPLIFDAVCHTYRKLGAVAGLAFKDGLKLK